MTSHWKKLSLTRSVATTLVISFLLPFAAGCGSKDNGTAAPMVNTPPGPSSPMATTPMQKPGMSRGKKVVIVLAGAALLYYLYKKHQAQQQATGATGQPQLYRSRNGGIYYRDAQHRAVWVTAPAQSMQVPASEVQQYASDYQQYQGQPAPPAPPNYRTQSFSQLDPGLTQDSSQ